MQINYHNYSDQEFTCPKCSWMGKGSETFLSELSEIHTFRDIECPVCETTLFTFDLHKIDLNDDTSNK